jgi:hypothetical protein
MTGISAVRSACVAGLAFAFSGSAAQAISIAYVKNGGNDALTCADVANACQTIGGALTKVDEGGEIYIVDTSNYEFVAINKSISIIALQPQGHIHAFGGGLRLPSTPARTTSSTSLVLTSMAARERTSSASASCRLVAWICATA